MKAFIFDRRADQQARVDLRARLEHYGFEVLDTWMDEGVRMALFILDDISSMPDDMPAYLHELGKKNNLPIVITESAGLNRVLETLAFEREKFRSSIAIATRAELPGMLASLEGFDEL